MVCNKELDAKKDFLKELKFTLTLFRMGAGKKPPPTSFPPVTSTNRN